MIYYLQTEDIRLLVTIYSKTEQSDLSAKQIKRIIEEELDTDNGADQIHEDTPIY